MPKIEYRVRPVTRYIVTRYDGGTSSVKGEYDNDKMAYEVAYALCKAEHDKAGTFPGDLDFVYPDAKNYRTGMDPVPTDEELQARHRISAFGSVWRT